MNYHMVSGISIATDLSMVSMVVQTTDINMDLCCSMGPVNYHIPQSQHYQAHQHGFRWQQRPLTSIWTLVVEQHRLMYLNACLSERGTAGKGLGGVVLLE